MRTALFGSSSSSSGLSSLPDHGTSTASANNNQRVKDLFNKWLQTEAPKQQYGGKTWEQLPEATLCRREIHAEFGHFLVHEYIIESGRNEGELLDLVTVLKLFGGSDP